MSANCVICTTMEQPRVILQPPACQMYIDPKPVNERLLELSMKTGYDCIQRNGQRHYGPPPNWVGPPPPRGSEVFIGRLPRDCFEDELVPVLESVGPIYEVRMMMNFTGFNRGFAFATYCSPRDAWRAVLALHDFEIRPTHRLGLSKSVDNCRLYIGGVPTDKTKADAWEELSKVIPTVKNIIMYPNPEDRSRNRGFFFAEFESHRAAAMAKRVMVPGTVKLWDQDVIVDWADPEPDVDPAIMATITKLFVRDLNKRIDSDVLKSLLREVVPMQAVQRIYVAGHYAFVHFDSRVHAQIAKDKLQSVAIDEEPLEVQWARPRCFKKQSVMTSHCRSVPPRMRKGTQINFPPNKIPVPYIPIYQPVQYIN